MDKLSSEKICTKDQKLSSSFKKVFLPASPLPLLQLPQLLLPYFIAAKAAVFSMHQLLIICSLLGDVSTEKKLFILMKGLGSILFYRSYDLSF